MSSLVAHPLRQVVAFLADRPVQLVVEGRAVSAGKADADPSVAV
jgi:hypothetical protein